MLGKNGKNGKNVSTVFDVEVLCIFFVNATRHFGNRKQQLSDYYHFTDNK